MSSWSCYLMLSFLHLHNRLENTLHVLLYDTREMCKKSQSCLLGIAILMLSIPPHNRLEKHALLPRCRLWR